jgi:lipopolysaccharide transport system ATP-binding protein
MIQRRERRSPGDPLVELRGLSKRFVIRTDAQRSIQNAFVNLFRPKRDERHDFWSLRDISLRIDPGDTVGIIGPNGSGKSTLLKLITGILKPTTGDIIVSGRVSSLLELGAGFHGDLTGRENIFLNGSIVGLSHREMQACIDSIIDFAELDEFINVPVKHYSSGMYVRLGFAVAIHSQPDLLIVDEVLAVGDIAFQHKCLDSIEKFRRGGGTLLLVSHDLSTIQSLCSRAVWIEHGRMMAEGVPTDVVMSYLNAVAQHEEGAARQEPRSPAEGGQRWGTGRVRVTKLAMFDGHGAPCTIFVDGGAMEIRMHYFAPERVERPIFGLAFHNQNGVHISGPNTKFGRCYIPYVEGDGIVTFRISSLALLEGSYLISTAVINETDTEMFDYNDRAYHFRVYPGSSNEHYGLMTFGGTWDFAADK